MRLYRRLGRIGLLAVLLCASACASSPEMIPVERVADYSEKADYSPKPTFGGQVDGEEPEPSKCQEYRDDIEMYQTAYLASVGLGVTSVLAGLLSDDETAHKVAGLAGALSTVAQAGTATAAEITAKNAQERGCRLE